LLAGQISAPDTDDRERRYDRLEEIAGDPHGHHRSVRPWMGVARQLKISVDALLD
jgi:hypothetical protein